MLKSRNRVMVIGQIAGGRFFWPGRGIAIAIEDNGHVLPEKPWQQILQGLIERRAASQGCFKFGCDFIQGICDCRIKGNVYRRNGLGGTHGAEFKLVACKGKGTGAVAVGEIDRKRRQC